jgi:hypothetical protein
MSTISKGWRPSLSPASARPLAIRAEELRAALRLREPGPMAARSGAEYVKLDSSRGELHIPLWGENCALTWPELTARAEQGRDFPEILQTLVLYYLATADGTALSGEWVSFADLPEGRVYHSAFQGYSGDELVKAISSDLRAFESACRRAGGVQAAVGDASFVFRALPRIPLMATYWLGDEDFPSSCKILFDRSACHYLPIDGCAVLGGSLVRRLLRT